LNLDSRIKVLPVVLTRAPTAIISLGIAYAPLISCGDSLLRIPPEPPASFFRLLLELDQALLVLCVRRV